MISIFIVNFQRLLFHDISGSQAVQGRSSHILAANDRTIVKNHRPELFRICFSEAVADIQRAAADHAEKDALLHILMLRPDHIPVSPVETAVINGIIGVLQRMLHKASWHHRRIVIAVS